MNNMRLFNFYLDDATKELAIAKLERLTGEKPKGQLASLIRVLLREFVITPDDKISANLGELIEKEYQYTTKMNKRSKN